MARGKRYEGTFKQETVKYILENNKAVAQFARETSVNENTLHGWVKKYGQKPEIKTAQTFSTPNAELQALQKQFFVYFLDVVSNQHQPLYYQVI